MDVTRNTIVFKISVDTAESCGKLANFIYKRENHLDMDHEEIDIVIYKYYMKETYSDRISDKWIRKIYNDAKFINIRQPENIKKVTSVFDVVYCVVIDPTMDIVDISNIFLIKHFYSKLNILLLFEKCSDDNYFRTSQFLTSVNEKYPHFYEDCFFDCRGHIQRAQKNDVQFSRKFVPLQIIDKKNLQRLSQKVNDILEYDQIVNIISGGKGIDDVKEEFIIVAAKLLRGCTRIPSTDQIETVVSLVENLDVLSFLMLCCTISSKDQKSSFEKTILQKYIYEIQQYAGAVRQLAENVVYHSKMSYGTLTIRIHAADSDYMKNQYGIEEKGKESYLEIAVSDFCGDELRENIAQNFVRNIKDEKMKEKFKDLCPASFFVHEKGISVENAWNTFYEEPENIGKHFGLKIFQNIVTTFEGHFGAESHTDYINRRGDCYYSYNGNEKRYCMPGTQYRIAVPLMRFRNVIAKQDTSLDSGLGIGQSICHILNYTTKQKSIVWKRDVSETQEEKNRQIQELSKKFKDLASEENNCDILYLPMDNVVNGEIFAKALVIALYSIKRKLTIVLYQCTENQKHDIYNTLKYSLQGTTQGRYLTGGVPPVRFSM